MRAGKLRNKANIYAPSNTTNEWGEVNADFTLIGTYACSITTMPRREYEESQAYVSKTEFDLRFRYYEALATLPRDAYIEVKGYTLQVNSIANIQLRDREIQIICEERS